MAVVRCFEVLQQPEATPHDFLVRAKIAQQRGIHSIDVPAWPEDKPRGDVRQCLQRLRDAKILVVGRDPGNMGASIKDVCGTEVVPITFDQLKHAYEEADETQALSIRRPLDSAGPASC